MIESADPLPLIRAMADWDPGVGRDDDLVSIVEQEIRGENA